MFAPKKRKVNPTSSGNLKRNSNLHSADVFEITGDAHRATRVGDRHFVAKNLIVGRIGHLGIVDLLRFEQRIDAANRQAEFAQAIVDLFEGTIRDFHLLRRLLLYWK